MSVYSHTDAAKSFFNIHINLCIISLDLTFDQLVTQCQTTVFKYYESRREVPLYDPAVMGDFCEKSAPELFDLLLKSITNER